MLTPAFQSLKNSNPASRLLIFFLLAAAHLGLLSYWSQIRMGWNDKQDDEAPRFFWLAPAQTETRSPEKPVERAFPPLPARVRPTSRPTVPRVDAPPVTPVTESITDGVSAPSASTTTITPMSEVTAIDRNVRQIYRDVEKELKQAFPNRIPPELVAARGSFREFQRQVAAAARNSDLIYQTYTTPDGTLVTKVTSSSGSYCVSAPNTAGGATIIEREGKGFRVMTC